MTFEKINYELIINKDLLKQFCLNNDFIIITDDMLKENNMFKDIVYATNNNFIGKSIYPKDMPLIINVDIWNKLIKINNELKKNNMCLKIYDAYRPIVVQKMFWEQFYNIYGYYDEQLVANPDKYGTHNITINAVDITLADLSGDDVSLPCEFDDFSKKASINYNDCSEIAKQNRDLLINTAQKYGLLVNSDEWWHYYDERLSTYGMKYNYRNSPFVPTGEEDMFLIKKII